ncbi:nucleosidase [Planomonospora parontospora subsp. parontospora]|uniref:Nucleosidase n=2 Tax=Planomonospora parontospora TaxID=58119 RepID=A0AA37BN91_9ACTN|nr:nucleosidase [Planomonospora parontospora]GGK93886.1 nucleosidase [Planomonospora parontospora]GII12416.1 nucleosidase [Planomonospora parontospora subsp. parontospora]
MELVGKITADRPLLVVAVKEEAQFLDTDLPVLLTGIGKVEAAVALATVLAGGPRPSHVVNLGTAGALRPGWTGTHVVGTVIQHDLDTELLRALTGETYGAALTLSVDGGPILATGDAFIADEAARERLAARAHLVDMEGYALASAAARAGVPIRIVKHVSDDAGDGAAKSWRESVADCARSLAGWTARHLDR